MGEEVLENIKTIESIPLVLQKKVSIVVRGEVFITKEEFLRLNKERKGNNLPLYANPRNIAAGSIRQLDPKIAASRNLDFFAYDLVADKRKGEIVNPFNAKTHKEKHDLLRSFGFKTVQLEKECFNVEDIFLFYKKVSNLREKLSYEIDGIAIFVNNNNIFHKIGVVGKSPRGAIAYKFPLQQRTTVIEDVSFQVGRTGVITPVALLHPVNLAGVTISRATLHNEDEIKRLDIKIGDSVVVGRAGDVIPRVVKVLKELRKGDEKKIFFPQKCPLCESALFRPKDEARWYCKNKDCYGVKREKFIHFVSRKGFNIDGLGEKIIDQLISTGIVSHPAELFTLKEGDLLPLERFAEKSAKNIIFAIKEKKKIPFSRFLYALSIPHVGEQTARLLSNHFKNLSNLKKASLSQFSEISDIGPVTAESVFNFLRKNEKTLSYLKDVGVRIIKETSGELFQGKTFVFTGTLSVPREELKERIVEEGGKISSSVSLSTDYLVCGRNPGSKLEKAKKLGIRILNEEEFIYDYLKDKRI